jgi:hypothetical protein
LALPQVPLLPPRAVNWLWKADFAAGSKAVEIGVGIRPIALLVKILSVIANIFVILK